MADARFEEGGEGPLRLRADGAEDLEILSALTQDAVGKIGNVHFAPRRRRFSLLLYRFRWEDRARAAKERRPFERVAAAMTFDDVLRARVTGCDLRQKDSVFNLLSLNFEPGEDGAGRLQLLCSEGIAFALDVECVNAALVDLTRPWAAGGEPQHF